MLGIGETRKEVIRPDFNRAIMIYFHGAKITSDVGFLPLREIDARFKIIDPMQDCMDDLRWPSHTNDISSWGSGFLTVPGGGMYTRPALSLYLTITGRYWPGAHRPQTHKDSARKRG